MTWIDYGLIGIAAISTLFGILRGFAREAWSLGTWLTAIVLGVMYAPKAAPYLVEYVDGTVAQHGAAFLSIAILIFITSSLVRLVFAQFFYTSELGSLNRFLGLVFGLGRGTIIMAILIILVGMSSISNSSAWKKSLVIPYIQPVSDWLLEKLPQPEGNKNEIALPKEN